MSLESVFKLSLIMNMVDSLTGPMSTAASLVGGSLSKLESASQAFGGMVKAGAVMQQTGVAIAGSVLGPATASFETRRALGELASLGVKDLDTLEGAARSFSDQWAGTTKADFISAAYDIKSGIASLSDEGVAEMTSLAALTAKATKSTAGEMTSLFATGYGIYKDYYSDLSDMEFGGMFSAGIAKSVQQFKTTGSGMAQSIQSLGASATNANVPLEEQFSILGMLQGTMSGSEAGTKYKAFLRSAAKGGEALGLSFMDANNQLLSMPEILDILRGKFGETMDAAEKMKLQEAFGDSESVALIDLMYGKVGDLQSNILGMYDALGSGTGVAEQMASAMNETEPERYERLTQRIQNVKETISNGLLPTINDLLGKGEQILTKVSEWVNKNQDLVRVILLVVLGIGGFLAVAGTVISVVGGIGLMFTKAAGLAKGFAGAVQKLPGMLDSIRLCGMYAGDGISKGFSFIKSAGISAVGGIKSFGTSIAGMARQAVTAASTALPPLIGSVWSFTAALLANPITWVVIGIVALIGGLMLLYNKCEWFRNAVDAIFAFFSEKLGGIFDFAKSVFSGIAGAIGSGMDAAKEKASETLSNMQAAFESHGGGIKGAAAAIVEGVKGVFATGFAFLDGLTGGKLTEIKNKFTEKISGIRDAVGSGMDAAKEKASETLTNMQAAFESHGGGIQGAAAAAFEGVKGTFETGYAFLNNVTGGKLTALKDTVTQKLGDMRAAYESHGGGIQGVAAAAMEGLKGVYSAGYDFINGITGGKLGEIKEKFFAGVSAIRDGIGSKISEIGTKFSQGIDNIKNSVTNAVTWFFNSGAKVVSTFAEGIRSAFGNAVSAVQGGLQQIRNMLPFSDAKTGPLSTLTLSGKRTMTTYAHGLTLAQAAPAQAMETALGRTRTVLQREPVKKAGFSSEKKDSGEDESASGGDSSNAGVYIAELLLNVDFSKIKELPLLLKLLEELKNYTDGNGGGDASPEPA